MYPIGIEPSHVAEYLDTNLELGRGVRANREKACLSSMFTWLIRTGQAAVKSNPCKGVRRNKETKRDRYVEDEEMLATLATAPIQVRAMAELVYRTLQRPEDIIGWTPRNFTERRDTGGQLVRIIRTRQGKTGAAVDIEITRLLTPSHQVRSARHARVGGVVKDAFAQQHQPVLHDQHADADLGQSLRMERCRQWVQFVRLAIGLAQNQ